MKGPTIRLAIAIGRLLSLVAVLSCTSPAPSASEQTPVTATESRTSPGSGSSTLTAPPKCNTPDSGCAVFDTRFEVGPVVCFPPTDVTECERALGVLILDHLGHAGLPVTLRYLWCHGIPSKDIGMTISYADSTIYAAAITSRAPYASVHMVSPDIQCELGHDLGAPRHVISLP